MIAMKMREQQSFGRARVETHQTQIAHRTASDIDNEHLAIDNDS